jgi:PAS domain S-box-containing protein
MSDLPPSNSDLSAEMLYKILDHLPTPIYVKDEQLRFVFSNKIHCESVGKKSAELLGLTDHDIHPPEMALLFAKDDLEVMNTGTPLVREEQVQYVDGLLHDSLSRKAKLVLNDGRAYLIGTNSDLTEIKQREAQNRALTETIPVGVMQVEENGQISFANPLLYGYFNCDSASLRIEDICTMIGRSVVEFPGITGRFECEVRAGNTMSRRLLLISSGWLRLGRDDKRSAIVSVVDVSENVELKRINEEILRLNTELANNMRLLREAQDALVKKGRMEQMGQLTATIAHELRNPLGTVRTSAFVMERRLKDSSIDLSTQFERIKNGITRCDNIIGQLLDYSRGKPLVCKMMNLDEWLAKIIEEEAARLPANVNVNYLMGLNGRHVSFDSGRLQCAIVNLISNASEALVGLDGSAAKPDAPEAQISVLTNVEGAFVTIRVCDNGQGMTAEIVNKIREPLFTTKSFGTGLGIPVIEQVAAQHGGSLVIESEIGIGSTFTLKLPAYEQLPMQILA